MLSLPLTLALALAPPTEAAPTPTEGQASPDRQPDEPEFGELEAAPTSEPDDDGASGYGTLAPLPNYTDDGADDGADDTTAPPPVVEEPVEPKKKKRQAGFQEPEDFGPFFEPEPASEVRFPAEAHRPHKKPFASVANASFCFVEDSACGAALIADADVGIGLNVISSDRGLDVPYTQFRVRGGLTVRPIKLARKRWHPWGVGAVLSWSLGSGAITATNQDPSDPFADVTETDPIRSWRVALLNQLWLSQRRNALHLDFTLGGVNSSVLDAQGRYWGTHAEVALGFGGWGGLFLAGDFLDADTRVFMGMRGHGIATGPLIGLIVLGLVAGGVAL